MSAFDEFIVLAESYRLAKLAQRQGQAYFNALFAVHPEIAEAVMADFRVDPFDDDDRVPRFLEFVRERLEGATA